MKINPKFYFLSMVLALLTFVSCDSDDDDPNPQPDPDPEQTEQTKFFIAAENEGTYFLTVDSLNGGTTTTTNNGIEDAQSYTHYAYNGTEAVLALYYRQGNPSLGRVFGLDESGELAEVGAGFQMTAGFSSIGSFENYIIATKGGVTFADESVGQNFYFIDLDNDGAISDKQLVTNGLVREDEEAQLIGVVDAGDGTFLSAVQPNNGVDTCFIVKLDADLNVIKVMDDDRIGQALGQWRSARYSLIANDDDGNTYVFGSPNGGTKSGGVLRINQGADDFDASYYFDIQAQSNFSFRKVFHITGSYFMLEFYNEAAPTNNTAATQYGIVNVETKSFSWITGWPALENIQDIGWAFSADGLAYVPITTLDADPTVYVIDPATATATKGVVVEGATSIGGLAKLTY